MGGKSAPSAPDPWQSAAAQYQYGTAAANYGTALNRPNIETPYGSTTWSTSAQPTGPGYTGGPAGSAGAPTPPNMQPQTANPTGSAPSPGSSMPAYSAGGGDPLQTVVNEALAKSRAPGAAGGGSQLTPPNYTEQFTLSPAEQALFNFNQGGELGIGGKSATSALGGGYATSVPGASDIPAFTEQARQAAYEQQTQYLDPQFQQQGEQLDAQLRNSGAYPGSPAYDNAMTLFNNQKQQAYTNASNNAVGAGLSEQQGLFGEGLQSGEFGNQAIMAGLGETGFGGAPPSFGLGGGGNGAGSVNAPDIMSAFNQQYQGQLAGYNADVSSTNQALGTAASLAAMYLMFA